MKAYRYLLSLAVIYLTADFVYAGVTVTQNGLAGATSWPGTPVLSTMSNPSATATVGEGFNSSNTNISQTFTVTATNFVLQTIDLYIGGGSGTGSGTNFNLNLYDLGAQTAPNPSPYTVNIVGANLLGSGAGLPISYSVQANGILRLDFTGADQVVLQGGHEYAFEIAGVPGTLPAYWYRSGADTYSGGAAYRNQSWINGSSARDFALAVYGSPTNSVATTSLCTVDWGAVFQRIDGFGASSAWRSTWTIAQADMFFSTNASGTGSSLDGKTNFAYAGCGLSLLRNRIAYASSTASTAVPGSWETSIMQYAQARGARVWSTPWTPPAGFKSTNDIYDAKVATGGGLNGGSYLGSGNNLTNLNYASQLANYVANMKNAYGVNLYAISIQNEPDASVTNYEACQWTGQQIHDFATNLHAALSVAGVGFTKIILPESQNWAGNPGLSTPTLNDPNAAAQVSIIANHNYVANNAVGDTSTPAPISASGQAVWESEVAQLGGNYDGSITNAIYWAGRIHFFLTAAQANAWHYWWLLPSSGNDALTDTNGIPGKRMYALGQFSRFVRPNYYRINIANNTGAAQISAYKDSVSPGFAIVAINPGSAGFTQTFVLTNVSGVASVIPWLTSGTTNLALQPAVTVSNATFVYSLPAWSMVTFVGQSVSNLPPVLATVANQIINPGYALSLTNMASDASQPAQTLTFTLQSAPTNAALTQLNNSNAVFSWRPLLSQANTTNVVKVAVSDSGEPVLAATNSFSVVVNPLVSPGISSVTLTGGKMVLTATGLLGPDYTLWASTNLANWQPVLTSNSPSLPVSLVETNFNTYPQRFYRVLIGP